MCSFFRPFLALFTAALLLSTTSFALDTPLSEEAIREAYFLGQRHDGALESFLDKYTKPLPPPKTGPHIASVTFFTPFALVAQLSSEHTVGYSAQQAQIDHRGQEESVRIIVQILLTDSYAAAIPRPTGSRSGSTVGFVPRPYDFWKDFQVQVFSKDETIKPFSSWGRPNYICSDDGGCTLTGATLYFDLLAKSFDSGSASIDVTPPEGDPVSLDFDLSSLR